MQHNIYSGQKDPHKENVDNIFNTINNPIVKRKRTPFCNYCWYCYFISTGYVECRATKCLRDGNKD